MFNMLAQWIKDALAHSGMSGAELSRRLTERLGRSIDRAAIQKMQMTGTTGKTKPRAVSADELFAIADITDFPIPADLEPEQQVHSVPLLSWVNAGALAQSDFVLPDGLRSIAVAGLPSGAWIALTVEGTSMDRISPPGSVILVNTREKTLVLNACYVISDSDGSITYKRYRPDPPRFEPVSTFENHETLYPQQNPIVIGRVRRTILDM